MDLYGQFQLRISFHGAAGKPENQEEIDTNDKLGIKLLGSWSCEEVNYVLQVAIVDLLPDVLFVGVQRFNRYRTN